MGKLSDFFKKILGRKDDTKLLDSGDDRPHNNDAYTTQSTKSHVVTRHTRASYPAPDDPPKYWQDQGDTTRQQYSQYGGQNQGGYAQQPQYQQYGGPSQGGYAQQYTPAPGNSHPVTRVRRDNNTPIQVPVQQEQSYSQAGNLQQTAPATPSQADNSWRQSLQVPNIEELNRQIYAQRERESNLREGDAVISAILQQCGARMELAQNPAVIETVAKQLRNGMVFGVMPARASDSYLPTFKTDTQKHDQIRQLISGGIDVQNQTGVRAIWIDKQTGSIYIKNDERAGLSGDLDYKIITMDENNEVCIGEETWINASRNSQNQANNNMFMAASSNMYYDQNGIMQRYNLKENALNTKTNTVRQVYESECVRDPQNPAIARFSMKQPYYANTEDIVYQSHNQYEIGGTWFFAIEPKNVVDLQPARWFVEAVNGRRDNYEQGIPRVTREDACADVENMARRADLGQQVRETPYNPRYSKGVNSIAAAIDAYRTNNDITM